MKRIGIALVVLLVGAACSSTGATTTTVETTTTTEAEVTTTVAAPSTTTAPPTTAPAASGNIAECVVGTWELDSQPFLDQLTDMAMAEGGPGGEFTFAFTYLGGTFQVTMTAEGTATTTKDDWTLGIESPFGAVEMKANQIQEGTYTIDGDTLTVIGSDLGELSDIEFTVNGRPFEFPTGVVPIEPPDLPISEGRTSCDDTTMSIIVDEITSTWQRIG